MRFIQLFDIFCIFSSYTFWHYSLQLHPLPRSCSRFWTIFVLLSMFMWDNLQFRSLDDVDNDGYNEQPLWTLIQYFNPSPSCINFINILRAHFSYESLLSSFSLLRVWLWTNICTKNAPVKCWWNWLLHDNSSKCMSNLLPFPNP